MQKRLYKDPNRKMISGVLAGLSDYLNIDVTIVRVVYIILSFATTGFPGIILYIILAIVVPDKEDLERDNYRNNNSNSYNKTNNDNSRSHKSYHDVEYKENPNPNDINYNNSSRAKGGSYSPKDKSNN